MKVNTNQWIADEVRSLKNNVFATAPSIDEVIKNTSDTISVAIAVNTTLELVAQAFEKQLSSYAIREDIANREGGDE